MSSVSYSEVVFDASDRSSFQALKKTLSHEKGEILVEAFNRILERNAGLATIIMLQSDSTNETDASALVMKAIDEQLTGSSANDIIEKSKKLIDQEIVSIELNATESLLAEGKINSIKLSDLSYEVNKSDPDRITVPMDFKVTNNSTKAISTIYMKCKFTTPDRKTPWYERETKHSIPGGIEPGETLSLKVTPNFFGWDKTEEIPTDAVLSAVVYRVDDAHKLELWKVDNDALKQLSKLNSLRDLSLSYSEAVKK